MPVLSLPRVRWIHSLRCCRRASRQQSFSSSSSSFHKCTTVWERSAQKVMNTDTHKNPYLDAIRETHDPAWHIKTLEEELAQTIGQALGRQGEKIMTALASMNAEYQTYCSTSPPTDVECAKRYNEHRKQAIDARWELMVHRQAAGFIIGNHEYVMKTFPIPPALPEGETPEKCVVPQAPGRSEEPDKDSRSIGLVATDR